MERWREVFIKLTMHRFRTLYQIGDLLSFARLLSSASSKPCAKNALSQAKAFKETRSQDCFPKAEIPGSVHDSDPGHAACIIMGP